MTEYKSNFKVEINICVLLLQENEKFNCFDSYTKMLKGCEEMLVSRNRDKHCELRYVINVIAVLRDRQVPFRVCVF